MSRTRVRLPDRDRLTSPLRVTRWRMFEPFQVAGPIRALAVMALVSALGTGFFLAGSALFFVKVVGLTPVETSIGMSAAGFTGFVAAPLLGQFSDRFGARRVYKVLTLVQAAMFLTYPWVSSFPLFVTVVCAVAAAEFGAVPAWASLVADCVPADIRVETRGKYRALVNLGLTVGSLATSVVIAVGTAEAYYSLVVVNGLSLVLCVLAAGRLPDVRPKPHAPGAPRFAALRDGPYLSVVAVSSVLSLHGAVLAVVLPLWIVGHTSAPGWFLPLLMTVNTVLAIAFQVRVSSLAPTWRPAARLARWSGLFLTGSFAVFALSGRIGGLSLAALLLLGIVLLTAAELGQSASAWGLAYDLAPPDRQGEYQGAFALTTPVQSTLGPVLGTLVLADSGGLGWLPLGALVLVASWLVVPCAYRSAARLATPAESPLPAYEKRPLP
ncbi:MFS transporter [Streptomyces luteogriseus]|uniref:MFS transporter n=1 Tax=Streptomyces luteogriseus TaxID=68233 RepID=UPI0037F490C2